ncbi:toll/interleukin-1 receptor domain-containing protein [Frankia sp. AiPs1]|uniref:toll/interleukin-1 receptor domain-containing protein n=1 Tax=Frankia sp. AiPs1 TaxID=573493 RepID=UPI0020434A2B|nr:toll/interleukin-1 receptor domain-containing protein [Frankia sp. AiPs1]MCM3923327.1 toll/interleukin-1 receptor domain-containing protein [Frankia sp. AiPs1]
MTPTASLWQSVCVIADALGGGQPVDEGADFYISYVEADRAWAEWAAWQVEDAGHRVRIREWDFTVGSHIVGETQRALVAARTIAVVSTDYIRSAAVSAEWQAMLATDPSGEQRRLLVVRVEDCELPGLLKQVSCLDLFGLHAAPARDRLLTAVRGRRRKPAVSPGFPGRRAARIEPGFPGNALVRDADARRLGVHPAVNVPGVPSEALPTYVVRDVDEAEGGLRPRLRKAAARGGFVLLLGASSVGKTRSAVEAVRAIFPDWRLIRPVGPGEVATLAENAPGRLVLWLDELQLYLDGHDGLTRQTMISLLDAPEPVVVVATAWPGWYAPRIVPPEPGAQDPHLRERDVLTLAEVIRIADEFSPAEQARAAQAAAADRQLEAAMATEGYGLTQTLAAAPLLVSRWSDAKAGAPYAWAVLAAAIDATRLGFFAPLPVDLLRDAAVDYCTPRQQAEAPGDWFEQALAYATHKLHGAASALFPVAAGIGRVTGFQVADYLYQYVSAARRRSRVPASAWAALVAQVTCVADCRRLADSAAARMLYGVAVPLYRTAAAAGDIEAAYLLAEILGDHDGFDELCRRAEDGDVFATNKRNRLALDALVEGGHFEELRQHAESGDADAARRFAYMLVERGDLDGFRRYVDVDREVGEYPDLDRGDDPQSSQAGYTGYVSFRITDRLHDDSANLDSRTALGKTLVAMYLHQCIVQDNYARYDDETLHEVATMLGDGDASLHLNQRHVDRAGLDDLHHWADDGDSRAAQRLADLLAERGDLEELNRLAHAGYPHAAERLPDLLARLGRTLEANRIRRFGFTPDGSIANPERSQR